MPFYYDRITGQSGIDQYMNFIENEIYIDELKFNTDDTFNYQLIEIRRAIGRSIEFTKQQYNENLAGEAKKQNLILSTTNKICGTLEEGFNHISEELISGFSNLGNGLDEINWRLNDVNEGISRLYGILDWKTDVLIEGQKITNLYLGKVTELLQIPDSQKQRGYHTEKGLTFLKNAIEEGPKSDFYDDALDEFLKGYDIERKDYFNLHKLGFIHLNSINNLDVNKSNEYFKLSARYAKAESKPQDAASALNYASRCNYILNNQSEAVILAKQAFEIEPMNPEFGYQYAKCLAIIGDEIKASEILKKVIELDKYFSVKVFADKDLIEKNSVVNMLNQISEELIGLVSSEIESLKSLIVRGSPLSDELKKVEEIFTNKNYLNARIAADFLF